jgi:hypothetical protein
MIRISAPQSEAWMKLDANAVAVLYVLDMHQCNSQGVRVSTKKLCDETRLSRASFFRAISKLKENSLVEVTQYKGPKGYLNEYLVNPEVRFSGRIESHTETR